MNDENFPVVHNEADSQFELTLGDEQDDLAVAEYVMQGDVMVFTHTLVPSKHEGHGYGSLLAKAALDYAQAEGYKVRPQCWFIAGYIERHAEYQPLLAK